MGTTDIFAEEQQSEQQTQTQTQAQTHTHTQATPAVLPIKVALLGTGIFAGNCTFPTIRKLPDKFDLVAVWSRRKESVEDFFEKHIRTDATSNTKSKTNCDRNDIDNDCCDGVRGYSGDNGLDQILCNTNNDLFVDAVVIALPISAQPLFIERALRAGKHVLSEKPIAATLEEAKRLVLVYEGINRKRRKIEQQPALQWSVAENFRYEPAIERVSRAVGGEIGNPTLFSLLIRLPFKPNNNYLQTEWRSKPSWYGGLMPDVFVHSTALLRKVLLSAASAFPPPKNEPKVVVSAVTTSTADHIPSIDTMSATLSLTNNDDTDNDKTNNGNSCHLHGTVSLSFACTHVRYELEVIGDKGGVLLQRKTTNGHGYTVTVLDEDGSERSRAEYSYEGIEKEFRSFANACRSRGCCNNNDIDKDGDDFGDCNTPLEAMRDIELVEACLESGLGNGKPIVVPISGLKF